MCKRALQQVCLSSRRADGGGAVRGCCAASPPCEAGPLSAPTRARFRGRAKRSSCRVCTTRPPRFCTAPRSAATRTNPGARPACFLASCRGHRREDQGPPGSLIPSPAPQTHLQPGAFVTRQAIALTSEGARQPSSIAKALGHWERWCPVSLGKGEPPLFFFLLKLKRNLAVLSQDTTAANQNKLLFLNAQNKPR